MPQDDIKKENAKDKKDSKEKSEKKEFPSWAKWVLIVFGVLIAAGGAFALTKYIIMPSYFNHKVEQVLEEQTEKLTNPKEEIGSIHYIKDITVNAKGSKGRRFIVAQFAIETSVKEVLGELKIREPQIRNEIITFLKENTVEEALATSFQNVSKTYLKGIINSKLSSGTIDSVYYTKLLIQ